MAIILVGCVAFWEPKSGKGSGADMTVVYWGNEYEKKWTGIFFLILLLLKQQSSKFNVEMLTGYVNAKM